MRGGGGGARGGGGRGGGGRGYVRGGASHGRGWRPGRPLGYVVEWPWIFAIPDEDGAGAPYSYCLEGLDADPDCAALYAGDDERFPMSSPYQQRIHIAGNIWVTLTRTPEGEWCAETEIQTLGGPIKLSARAHEQTIRNNVSRLTRKQLFRLVHKAIHALPPEAREPESMTAAGIFDDIGDFFTKTVPKAVKTVTKSKVFKDIAKGISDVASNPIVQGAMSIIPGGAILNEGMKQAGHAASLLSKAKSGDQVARAGIQTIANAAKAGSPKARKALTLMETMNANPMSFMPNLGGGGETAAGWDPSYAQQAQRATNLGPEAMARGVALLGRAFGGDPNAQNAVKAVARKADRGDPRAREVANLLASLAGAGQPRPLPAALQGQLGTMSGEDAGWPAARPVNPQAYAKMVEAFHAGGDIFRRRPHPRQVHPLRGHSMHYGLPYRTH